MATREEIQAIIVELIADELHLAPDTITRDASFHELGLDSVNSLFLLDDLERRLRMDIDPLSLYDNPTIASFVSYLDQIQHASD